MIFVGGLGLAVLAGPANCPCLGEFAAATEHTSTPRRDDVSRFAYMQPAAVIAAGELAAHFAGELPMLSTASLLDPDETIGVSPISTSATGPSRDAPAQASDDLAPARVGRLPLKIEQLADVAPTTIRLAAADVESDALPTLAAVTVDTPAIPEVVAVEAEREHAGKTHTSRGRLAAKAKMHRNGTHASKRTGHGVQGPRSGAAVGAADVRDALADQGLLLLRLTFSDASDAPRGAFCVTHRAGSLAPCGFRPFCFFQHC